MPAVKAIFFDAGGVLFLNNNGRGFVNPAVFEFIKQNRQDYVFGLLSSTDMDMRPALIEFGMADFFDLVQTTGALGIGKDRPEFFRHAIEQVRIEPQEAVMIDNDRDFIAAARAAGLLTVLYTLEVNIAEAVESLKS